MVVLERLATLVDLQTKLSIDDVDLMLMASDTIDDWMNRQRE